MLMITADALKFVKAKNDYANARKNERKKVINYLVRQVDGSGNPLFTKGATGKRLDNRGGCGNANYGDKRFKQKFDLSNWIWIEVCYKNELSVLISFQTFDIDPSTKNIHVLFDRIGMIVYEAVPDRKDNLKSAIFEWRKNDNNTRKVADVSNAIYLMQNTDIDLPLNDEKLKTLVCCIERVYEAKQRV